MTEDRTRGLVLYSLAGVVLLGGGLWFVRAAPGETPNPRIADWQARVEVALPDLPSQTLSDTIVLRSEMRTERTSAVDGGAYTLSLVCAGTGRVRVRLSSPGGADSGQAVPCSEDPVPERLRFSLADEFAMSVAGEETADGAVFRWRLERSRGY